MYPRGLTSGAHFRDRYAGLFDMQARGIDLKKAIDESQKKLDSTRYADVRTELGNIQAELRRARNEKRRVTATNVTWYSLWSGPPNVRELAKRVDMLSFYEIFYRSWSSVSHGSAALQRIAGKGDGGGVLVDAIRTPKNLPEMARNACSLTTHTALLVVEKLNTDLRQYLREQVQSTLRSALKGIEGISING